METINEAGAERRWAEILKPYSKPTLARSLFQLISTAALFGFTWWLMLRSLEWSYWITLLIAIPASGLLVRLFIIQHDCGHGSFFASRKANNAVGFALGVLTLTPYDYWRRTHAIHHATSGNLDQRQFGDIATWTVEEYLSKSSWKRFLYRLYRSPITLFVIGPAFQFMLKHRFPLDLPRAWKREWASVIWTNLGIAAVLTAMWFTVGIKAFLMVHIPIVMIGGAAGVWLFYIQHQFEDAYWKKDRGWSYNAAALEGSSYYDLPKVLHWFTGNIGVHHVHHLSSRIPNYRLQQCFRENPELQAAPRLTLWQSFQCARLKLWDEERKRMIRFRELARPGATA